MQRLFYVLQGGVILLTRADLDHLGHVVHKDLAIANVAGVQCLGGGVDDLLHRDLAHDNFHLDLGQQGGIHFGTAVLLAAAAKIDMSNAGPYDQGLNESFQNAFKDYFTGNVDEDTAKANFETAIKEKYPELTDVVWPA